MAMEIRSGIWIDEPDALERLDQKASAGEIRAGVAGRLRTLIEEGWVRFPLGDSAQAIDGLSESYDRLWQSRPADLALAYHGPPRRFPTAVESTDRAPSYRIHDPHSHLDEALDLYLHSELHEFARAIFDEDIVAIQSLLFEFGSEQTLHRDPITVPTGQPLHLFAAWIALEDIADDSGPLLYVPRSHRIPYYELAPGQYMFDESRMGQKEIDEGLAYYRSQFEENGLQTQRNTARRGEVLFWHASLFHGGAPVENPESTRKSFVVHFSSRRTYPARSITIAERGGESVRPVVWETTRLLSREGCVGFDNPLRGGIRAPS